MKEKRSFGNKKEIKMNKFIIHTMGCKSNQFEGSIILENLYMKSSQLKRNVHQLLNVHINHNHNFCIMLQKQVMQKLAIYTQMLYCYKMFLTCPLISTNCSFINLILYSLISSFTSSLVKFFESSLVYLNSVIQTSLNIFTPLVYRFFHKTSSVLL